MTPTPLTRTLWLVFTLCLLPTFAGELSARGLRREWRRSDAAEIAWHGDYAEAFQRAGDEGRMLVVFFHDGDHERLVSWLRRQAEVNSRLWDQLHRFVVADLDLDAEMTVAGESTRVLDHPAFADLAGQPGVAVIDLANQDAEHYGEVVSLLPISNRGAYRYDPRHLGVVLDLPSGSLTQRTMVFAVRIHPEQPASAWGQFQAELVQEAGSHSRYQAQLRSQGHHHWNQRFHRINTTLPAGEAAVEIVAESWPGQSLLDACLDCVASWRQSSGHWGAVRGRHRAYGYDIQRGSNGVWYATGIFGKRR